MGEVNANLGAEVQSKVVEFDLATLDSVRRSMPITQHAFYPSINREHTLMTMNQIETALLAPAGLTEQDIADTLSSISTRQID